MAEKNKDDEVVHYDFLYWGPLVTIMDTDLALCKKLENIGRKRRKQKELDYRDQLAGQLDHENTFEQTDKDWFVKHYGKYFDGYVSAYQERYGTNIGGLELKSLWINWMKPGEFNPLHHHSGHISFILYPNSYPEIEQEVEDFVGTGPGPGQVQFNYGFSSYGFAPEWNIRAHYFTPSAGKLYIFPALLQHQVCPFKSDVERVSISGNLSFRNAPTDENTR